jgi:hypothetical protein
MRFGRKLHGDYIVLSLMAFASLAVCSDIYKGMKAIYITVYFRMSWKYHYNILHRKKCSFVANTNHFLLNLQNLQ